MTTEDDLKDKVNELQLQFYIAMAVGFFAIVILLILDIVLFGMVERIKRQLHAANKERKPKLPNEESTFSGSMPRPEIHPAEDLARRGYRKYPNYSSGLVSRVESREESPYSRQQSVLSRQQLTP